MQWEVKRLEIQKSIREGISSFDELAIELFHCQYGFNRVYRQYVDLIYGQKPAIHAMAEIPFLPIQFFKSHVVQTGNFIPRVIFESSGTTGQIRSRHGVRDPEWYLESANRCFREAFEPYQVEDFKHLAVLPNYAENPSSSLLYMVDNFISSSSGGYYHSNPEKLMREVNFPDNKKKMIWGVSYALYQWPINSYFPPGVIIIETGGMKGRSKEITRQELHRDLKQRFGVDKIASEYGMTELLSQAYAMKDGIFSPNSTIKAFPRKINDPLSMEAIDQQAALNIIDLANIDSCAFIATEDLCRVFQDGRFEVLGRMDNSDVRGCNLLIV